MKKGKYSVNRLKLEKFEVARFEGSNKILGGSNNGGGGDNGETKTTSSLRCLIDNE